MGYKVSTGVAFGRHIGAWMAVAAMSCDAAAYSAAGRDAVPAPEPATDLPAPSAPAVVAQPSQATPVPAASHMTANASCPPGKLLVPGGRFSAKQYAFMQKSAKWSPNIPDLRLVLADHVDDFCLDKTEFTLARCRQAGKCRPKYAAPPDPSSDELPIEMEATEAASLCASEGGRLPTYEEWMWAYWGGDEERRYPWGREKPSPDRLNVCDISCSYPQLHGDAPDCETLATCKGLDRSFGDDGWEHAAPVGTYPKGAGRWGQLDMEGNVDEVVVVTPSLRFFFSMQLSGWYEAKRRPPVQVFFWGCGSTHQSDPPEVRKSNHNVCGGPYEDDGGRYPGGFRCASERRHSSSP